MTPERWHQITETFHAALGRDPGHRQAFLDNACHEDATLRREVEALLHGHDHAGSFAETPLFTQSASVSPLGPDRELRLAPGARLGSYEIIAALGAGGMGEVYRAHDTRLSRDIALKILPRTFADTAERLTRFRREARVLASLNHPNIAAIHGLEKSGDVDHLILELVEGEILSGPVPIDKALDYACQIAEALEAAHGKGIVHRDLKPANVKVTPEGKVKLLDFGLAKAVWGGEESLDLSRPLTTGTAAETVAGHIVGSPSYMSPEQARGQDVDERTDIWAFGCLLYELLTGRRAFPGEVLSDTIEGVLTREPDWKALPDRTPARIRQLLWRCLDKEPARRVQNIADARQTIEQTRRGWNRWQVAAIAAAALGTLALGGAVSVWPRVPAPTLPSRFAIVTAPAEPLNVSGSTRDLAVSPDGRHLVYRFGGTTTFGSPLMVRSIDRLDAQPLANVLLAYAPFFSPDGRWIGFFEAEDLKKVSINGGPIITVCGFSGTPLGASWGDDNTITFATSSPGTGLWRVPADGGKAIVLTTPDPAQRERSHAFPSVLPRGRGVLYTIASAGQADSSQVAVLDLKTGQRKTLIRGGSDARYVEPGYLIFAAAGTLRAVRFDPVGVEVLGDPVTVVERVMMKPSGAANYAVSQSGTLVYVPGEVAGAVGAQGALRSLVWVDRKGHEERIRLAPRALGPPRISPDGRSVAMGILERGNTEIWIWDLMREKLRQLTFAGGMNGLPVWTPDGQRIIFMSDRTGVLNLYSQAADGTGTADRITTSTTNQWPSSITPDGTHVIGFGVGPTIQSHIMRFALAGSGSQAEPDSSPGTSGSRAELLLQSPSEEDFAEISPDGRYLAYESTESGRDEVYVSPYPRVASDRWKISKRGGTRPAWARSGRELFYLDESGVLTSVPVVTSGPTFVAGSPANMFDTKYLQPNPARHYDVSPDGKRFLMLKESGADPKATPASMVVVEHWSDELKELVREFLSRK